MKLKEKSWFLLKTNTWIWTEMKTDEIDTFECVF